MGGHDFSRAGTAIGDVGFSREGQLGRIEYPAQQAALKISEIAYFHSPPPQRAKAAIQPKPSCDTSKLASFPVCGPSPDQPYNGSTILVS